MTRDTECDWAVAGGRSGGEKTLELETKVHPKVRNHGEGPY